MNCPLDNVTCTYGPCKKGCIYKKRDYSKIIIMLLWLTIVMSSLAVNVSPQFGTFLKWGSLVPEVIAAFFTFKLK
jgi:hypothetical protein